VRQKRSLFGLLAEQRRFIYLAIAVLSGAGIWAALQVPSAIYPELSFSRITVVVEGSSLGARQVMFSITRPIEEAIAIVPGVTRVQSRSIRGRKRDEYHVRSEDGHDLRAAAGAGAREPGAEARFRRGWTSRSSGSRRRSFQSSHTISRAATRRRCMISLAIRSNPSSLASPALAEWMCREAMCERSRSSQIRPASRRSR
jgi:hypothetical protein